jgi:hypothetical protein
MCRRIYDNAVCLARAPWRRIRGLWSRRHANDIELGIGIRNLDDENYELAWGFPSPGRAVYTKFKMSF